MKPQDLFLGIRDFLALLVPGIVLLLLAPVPTLQWLSKVITIDQRPPDASMLVLVFLAAALTTGSLLAGVAGLLDDPVDRYVKRQMERPADQDHRGMLKRQIGKLRETERLAAELACLINPIANDPDWKTPWTPRSFWWNYLRLNCPVAIAELDRIEGLQKQFRSLVVVAVAGILFAIAAPIEWTLPDGALGDIGQWRKALAPLWAFWPWFVSGIEGLIALFCFTAYVGYRVRFSRRLFEMAIIHAIPEKTIADGTSTFFSLEGRR